MQHDGEGLFRGLPDGFEAGRYHSLAATRIPDELEVCATAPDGEVMAVRHRTLPVHGVQFHPESVLTPVGPDLARNFLEGRVIQDALSALLDGRDLDRAEARDVMDSIMDGEATPAQIGGFLVALRSKGETADEIAGCAEAMREHVLAVKPQRGDLVDTAGTGGDGARTFNISTAAALVAAAAGAGVAKHGNRAVSSASGSADVLEALGFSLELEPERIERSIDELGFGFLFAPTHHPAMRHAAPVRRELGDANGLQRPRPADEPGRRPGPGRRRVRARARADDRRRAAQPRRRPAPSSSTAPAVSTSCRRPARTSSARWRTERFAPRDRPAGARGPALRAGGAARRRAGRQRANDPRDLRGRRRRTARRGAAERSRRDRAAGHAEDLAKGSSSRARRSTRAPPASGSRR